MTESLTVSYQDSGVDIDYAAHCLTLLDQTRSRRREVIKSNNDFAGLFSLHAINEKYADPILVSGTDGVGTKLLVAIECDSYDGLGQDLVAMCVNDIACKGAEPLFFLDYFASSNLKHVPFTKVVNGIVQACDEINCALIGGETAEMPKLYAPKHFDLAGFAVGVVDRAHLLGAHRVQEGDKLIGIKSSGLHANGFSLVRKIIFEDLKLKPNDVLWQTEAGVITVADELLKPTRLYANLVKNLMSAGLNISAIAHITGGGIVENIPRVIPDHLAARIDLTGIACPRIFQFLMDKGSVSPSEMMRTFNMGIGLIIAVSCQEQHALLKLRDCGEEAEIIGEVIGFQGGNKCQVNWS